MNSLKTVGSFTLLCIASLTIMVGVLLAPGLASISTSLGITDNSVLLITMASCTVLISTWYQGEAHLNMIAK